MTRPIRLAAPLLIAVVAASAEPLRAQVATAPPPGENPPLFASDEVLELTLVADFEQLDDDRAEENPERPARLQLTGADGAVIELPLDVRTRGGFRLRPSTCDFPNLRLDFDARPQAANTVFAGQNDIKLVAHCRDSDEYEQNTLEEYLAYRLYNLLTEESLRVRLARMTYRDVNDRGDPVTRYGFLIEDVDMLAARLGGLHLEVSGADPRELDGPSSVRVELFEYMIGNTDFSIVNFHNAEVIRLPDGTYHPVPYDFDFAGLVDAPYAMPSSILNTRSVRERVYRGFCRPAVDMDSLFESFLARRDAFARTIRAQPQLEPERAERAIRYLDEFFSTIESPRARRSLIERRCRETPD